ncbi:MAG: 3-deoxy-manno-octulosonate cytidylyltransferase [Sulfuricurvum sp. PC08-66]|nr:MAG: 3-deoxy-manno-octulosonate cytidylyltransferase [Sulfuricurvum sp. PC08-66]
MILIPARMGSTRFPQKVLADIGGVPMVVRTAQQVATVDDVMVATDDVRVMEVCHGYNIPSVLTSSTHKSGTDRIHEAVTLLGLAPDTLIINVQADEPFIEPAIITQLKNRLEALQKAHAPFIMASCYNTINDETAQDPNRVKVILDHHENAIYFSRSPIPFNRSGAASYFGHLGLYGFDVRSLGAFCQLSDAPIEDIEKLEQLRAIYHALPIAMVKVTSTAFGIDTAEDLERAKAIFLH